MSKHMRGVNGANDVPYVKKNSYFYCKFAN